MCQTRLSEFDGKHVVEEPVMMFRKGGIGLWGFAFMTASTVLL